MFTLLGKLKQPKTQTEHQLVNCLRKLLIAQILNFRKRFWHLKEAKLYHQEKEGLKFEATSWNNFHRC